MRSRIFIFFFVFFAAFHAHSATIAYDIVENTPGNQNYNFGLGMDFNVNSPIVVYNLGVFDASSDGIQGGTVLTVQLFKRDGTLIPNTTLTFDANDQGTRIGGHLFKPLPQPLLLDVESYSIVAYGFDGSNLNYNQGGNPNPGMTVNTGNGALTFVGGGRFGGNPGTLPPTIDGGPPNRYGAGTFDFETLGPSTLANVAYDVPAGQTGTVTDGGGLGMDFDLSSPITVYNVGVFDHSGDGIQGATTLTVQIYRRIGNTGILVPNTTIQFTKTRTGTLFGSSRFRTLPVPVSLPPGPYSIAAYGFDAANPAGISAAPTPWTTNDGGGAITFTGTGRSGTGGVGTYPQTAGPGPANLYAAGTFDFTVQSTRNIAYENPFGLAGNQAHGTGLGMDFDVNSPIIISNLGVFDDNSDGIQGGTVLTVQLFKRDGTLIPDTTLTFDANDQGTLIGGSRFKPLGAPLTLLPGQYCIASFGHDGANRNYNQGGAFEPRMLMNTGNGAISFVGGARYSFQGPDIFPPNLDGGPSNRYGGGTFDFDTQQWSSAVGGLWSNASNWIGGVPNAVDAYANFYQRLGESGTIDLDIAVTAAALNFDNFFSSYTIAGTNTITLQTTGAFSALTSLSGAHNVNVPLKLTQETRATVSTDSTLNIAGAMSSTAAAAFHKYGAGTLMLTGANTFTGTFTLEEGTLRVDGSLAATPLQVKDKTTVSGSGSVRKLIVEGTVSPGPGPLTLTCENADFSASFLTPTLYLVIPNPNTSAKLACSADAVLGGGSTLVLDLQGYPDGEYGRFVLMEAATITGLFKTVTVINDADAPERVSLFYRDNGATKQVVLSLNNHAPTVQLPASGNGVEGAAISETGNFADQDADVWSATVDYGDSTGVANLALNPDKSFSLSHAYGDNGTYTITVKVTDGSNTATGTMQMTITNAPPQKVSAGEAQTVAEGSTVDLSATFTDSGALDTHTFAWSVIASNGQNVPGGTARAFSFTPNNEGTYTATVIVTDDDGASASGYVVITVENAPPNSVHGGDDQVVDEGLEVVLDGTFVDPGTVDTHTYKWSVVAEDGQVIPDGDQQTFRFTPDDNGNYVVTFTVTDDALASASQVFTVTAINTGPTGVANNNGPCDEGSSGTIVSLDAPFDTSPVDDAAGFRYSFDFNNDGIFEIGDGSYFGSVSASSKVVPSQYLADGPGTRTVRIRIVDKDEGATDYTTDIVINNIAPTGVLNVAGSVGEGASTSVSFTSVFDPSTSDTAAGFTYSFDFGNDGNFEVSGRTPSATVPTAFLNEGPSTRVVAAKITDKDGGVSIIYKANIVVNNAPPTALFRKADTDHAAALEEVEFANPFDPSPTDAASLKYSFSFDGDTSFEVSGGSETKAVVPAQYRTKSPNHIVRGRIEDKDGGFTDYLLQQPEFGANPLLVTGELGSAFNYTIAAAGLPAPQFTIELVDPPAGVSTFADLGLTFDGTNLISGTLLKAGQITFRLIASNAAGEDRTWLVLTSSRGSDPHAPRFASTPTATPNPAQTGAEVTFSAVGADDDGDVVSYRWNFGDGSADSEFSRRKTPKHIYDAAGTYDVIVFISDGVQEVSQHVSLRVNGSSTSGLVISKAALSFDFKSPAKSSATFSGTIVPPAGFVLSGATVVFTVPGTALSKTFVLNSKGQGVLGLSKLTIGAPAKSGKTAGQSKISLALKSDPAPAASLFTLVSPLGFKNETTSKTGTPVNVPLTFTLGSTTRSTAVRMIYTATQDKSGKGKLSK